MRPLWSHNCHICIPLQIIDAESDGVCGRIGGRPPQGVYPATGTASHYFATVPFFRSPILLISIFVGSLVDLLNIKGRVSAPGVVVPIVHPPFPGGGDLQLASPLSAHWLEALQEVEDRMKNDEGNLVSRPGHKLGGRPHLIRERDGLLDELRQMDMGGFVHLIQFDFPGRMDAPVSGSWPFADGIFNLFGRPPFAPTDWRWFWDC